MRKSCLLILAVFPAALPMAGCSTTDHARLQGIWTGHEIGREGSQCRVVISESRIEFRGDRAKDWYKGTFTLDGEPEPKQLDGLIQECAVAKYVGKIARSIYRLEDTTLTLAGNEPGVEQRPTSFEASRRARVFVLTKQETP